MRAHVFHARIVRQAGRHTTAITQCVRHRHTPCATSPTTAASQRFAGPGSRHRARHRPAIQVARGHPHHSASPGRASRGATTRQCDRVRCASMVGWRSPRPPNDAAGSDSQLPHGCGGCALGRSGAASASFSACSCTCQPAADGRRAGRRAGRRSRLAPHSPASPTRHADPCCCRGARGGTR